MISKKKELLVFVVFGLLESGKTSLIQDLITDEQFDQEAKTLILSCEEGEEEYSMGLLQNHNCKLERITGEEGLQGKVMEKLLKKHRPDIIMIEYNGMWPVKVIPEMYDELEEICWDREVILQTMAVVNDETFSIYMKNMSSFMTEHFKMAELVVVNRCTMTTKRSALRGSIKAVNPRAQIVFESEDPEFYQREEELPFDLTQELIEIRDEDYGYWYVDMLEHPEKYKGKRYKLKGMIQKETGLRPGYVVFGRFVMTCCADDVQYIGFLCHGEDWTDINSKDYVTVIASLEYEYREEYKEEGPILFATQVHQADKPQEELVYFN